MVGVLLRVKEREKTELYKSIWPFCINIKQASRNFPGKYRKEYTFKVRFNQQVGLKVKYLIDEKMGYINKV